MTEKLMDVSPPIALQRRTGWASSTSRGSLLKDPVSSQTSRKSARVDW